MSDAKKCPKCSSDMVCRESVYAIPAMKDPTSSHQSEAFSTHKAMAVYPFVCEGCAFVEFYRSASQDQSSAAIL
jgi:predicted nucleic-acid-binding Zn-ribbon protein